MVFRYLNVQDTVDMTKTAQNLLPYTNAVKAIAVHQTNPRQTIYICHIHVCWCMFPMGCLLLRSA